MPTLRLTGFLLKEIERYEKHYFYPRTAIVADGHVH